MGRGGGCGNPKHGDTQNIVISGSDVVVAVVT